MLLIELHTPSNGKVNFGTGTGKVIDTVRQLYDYLCLTLPANEVDGLCNKLISQTETKSFETLAIGEYTIKWVDDDGVNPNDLPFY